MAVFFPEQIYNQTVPISRGADKLVSIPCYDQDKVPLDLSGASSAIWRVADSDDPAATKHITKQSPASGIEIVSDGATPPLWTLEISLDRADTVSMQPRLSYYHEASVTDANGDFYKVAAGQFHLYQAINP